MNIRNKAEMLRLTDVNLKGICQSVDKWKSFLTFAAQHYKQSFENVIAIQMQKPVSTAIADFNYWNKIGRSIIAGEKGIKVFMDDKIYGRMFDVSQTIGDDVKFQKLLWQYGESYKPVIEDVLEIKLENDDELLYSDILTGVSNLIYSNSPEFDRLVFELYDNDTHDFAVGCALNTVVESISFGVAYRLGISPIHNGFRYLNNLQEPLKVAVLHRTVDEISGFLRKIERRIRNDRSNQGQLTGNKNRGRRIASENLSAGRHTNIRNSGINSGNGGDGEAGRGTPPDEVQQTLFSVSARQSSTEILGAAARGQTAGATDTDRRSVLRALGQAEEPVRETADTVDERPEGLHGASADAGAGEQTSGGNRTPANVGEIRTGNTDSGVSKNSIDKEVKDEDTSLASLSLAIIDDILRQGEHLKPDKFKITTFFKKESDDKMRAEYIKNAYRDGCFTEHIVDGLRLGYVRRDTGLIMWQGSYLSRTAESTLTWHQVQDRVSILIERGSYITNLGVENTERSDNSMPGSRHTIFDEPEKSPLELLIEENQKTIPNENVKSDEKKQDTAVEEIIQAAKLNYHYAKEDFDGLNGAKTKFSVNIDAIKLLKEIESNERLATTDEQRVLARYSGWGGLAQAFDENNKSWTNEYIKLKELLTTDEYESARASTPTAFYTPPVVIESIYKALANFGFKGGNIIDPALGVGNFFSHMPEDIEQQSKLYGVELDSISGRISKQLYQKANIQITGFEDTAFQDNFIDVAVSNVPFGSIKLADNRYDKFNFLIHDYFFAKTIDKVRPGGMIIFVTSKGTMDKANEAVRRYIFQRADLIGAIRLPNTAFENANTEVTSDIIFLQKRNEIRVDEPPYIGLGYTDDGIPVNSYFAENPHMMLGKMSYDSNMYGSEKMTTLIPLTYRTLEDLLDEAANSLKAEIPEYVFEDEGVKDYLPADPSVRNFTFTVVDGEIYYRENSIMKHRGDLKQKEKERILGLHEIRTQLRTILNKQLERCSDEVLAAEQQRLTDLFDRFVKKYGHIADLGNSRAFKDDIDCQMLCALEIKNEDGSYEKASIFTKRTVKPPEPVTSVDNAKDALTLSMNERGFVDFRYMQFVYNKTAEEIETELQGEIYLNPVKYKDDDRFSAYEHKDEYLTGDVRTKLEVARTCAKSNPVFLPNFKALEDNLPEWIGPGEIDVRLGATWIDTNYYNQFMYELLNTPLWKRAGDSNSNPRNCIQIVYNKFNAQYTITNTYWEDSANVIQVYGTKRASAYNIIQDTLNLKDTLVKDAVEYVNGNGNDSVKYVVNPKETAIARQKQEEIREAFKTWIFKDPERRQVLTERYNQLFNSIRQRQYDGSTLHLPGLADGIKLRPHQLNAVARLKSGNNSLLAHVVGAGKTFTMIAGAKEQIRLGLTNKAMFVVPNHLIQQFGNDIYGLYPDSRVMVAQKQDFEKANRQRFLSRIALSDVEMIVIGHSQFEKISMSPVYQERQIREEKAELAAAISRIKEENGEPYTIKQLEVMLKNLDTQLKKLNDSSKKDKMVTFEQLGINSLFVDEAHYYKNCATFSKMRNVAGISNTHAKKSSDMLMKCKYINENGGVITFATGTPISNSMTELYVMQRYLQNDLLRERGIFHFDDWASTFGETVTSLELAPEGSGYRMRTRFCKFHNLPELMQLYREIADIQTSDMLNLPVPKLATGKAQVIACEPSEALEDFMKYSIPRVQAIRNRDVDPTIDNMLKFTGDAKKAGLDMRLINPESDRDPNGKLAVCADKVYLHYVDSQDFKGAQLIFCDTSTYNPKQKFDVYRAMKDELLSKGISENEIAFIHTAKTEKEKEALFAKVRSGDVRVLLGSTQKCGAGTNIQDRLIALHHLDCPYRPSDIEQREGRILRQGNNCDEVSIYRYVTKRSFDAYLWNIVETKQKFISQIMTSKTVTRSCEDLDEAVLGFAEAQAIASGDPRIKEKIEIDTDVARLQLLKTQHLNQHYKIEDELLHRYPNRIKSLDEEIRQLKADIVRRDSNRSEFFSIKIQGLSYTDMKEAGKRLVELERTVSQGQIADVGEYCGFKLFINNTSQWNEPQIALSGDGNYTVNLNRAAYSINIEKMNEMLLKLESKLSEAEHQLQETISSQDSAKEALNNPFKLEEELLQKLKRQAQLNEALKINEVENVIADEADNEIEEGEENEVEEEPEDDYDMER